MATSVKAYLTVEDGSHEIRRFTVDKVNFATLKTKIAEVFPSLGKSSFNIAWQDDEGDYVTMSSDAELKLAVSYLKDGVLRVYIRKLEKVTPTESQDGIPQTPHIGVRCDGCEGGVNGFRYKCMVCDDYDLCKHCETIGLHGEHPMMRIGPCMTENEMNWRSIWQAHKLWGQRRGGRCEGYGSGYGYWHKGYGSGHGHHRGGGPRKCGEHHQEASGAGSGPQRCHPFNPQHLMEKIWSTIGTIPHGQGSDFLKNVGETIAAVLDPLGIDVEVDVKQRNEKTKAAKDENAKDKAQSSASPQAENTNVKESSPPPLSTPSPDANSSPSNSPDKETGVIEPPAAEVNQVVPEKTEIPDVKNGEGKKQSSEVENGEWTYIEAKDTQREATPLSEELGASTEKTESSDGGARPKNYGLLASAVAEEMKKYSDIPLHPDPVIAETLKNMLSMGFTNDGGWLTQLVEVKQGNIDSVLDVLHPVRKQN